MKEIFKIAFLSLMGLFFSFSVVHASPLILGDSGISTDNPSDALQIYGSGASIGIIGDGRLSLNFYGETSSIPISFMNYNTDDRILSLYSDGSLAGQANGDIQFLTSDGDVDLIAGAEHNIQLYTGNNIGIYIDEDGSVAIGSHTPQAKLDINSDSFIVENSKTPSSSTDTCVKGTQAWDTDYYYVCVSANHWKRSTLSSW